MTAGPIYRRGREGAHLKYHPLPEDERVARLQRLGILDTPRDKPFCDVVAQVLKLFPGISIAAVSLVDTKRQWFKAIIGLDALETPRDVSFCAHTIQTSGTMVVEDATRDIRFADNRLVTSEPSIRFYAGVALMDGVGALCAIGPEPRQASAREVVALQRLAQYVDIQLMAHGTLHNLGATVAPAKRHRAQPATLP